MDELNLVSKELLDRVMDRTNMQRLRRSLVITGVAV